MHLRSWLGPCLCLASLACGETEPGPYEPESPTTKPLPAQDEPPSPSGGATQDDPPPSPSGGATQDDPPPSPGGGATQDESPSPSGGAPLTPGPTAGDDSTGAAGAPPLGGAAGAAPDPPGLDCEPIRFEDPELELAVRQMVGKPAGPLTGADVAGLTQLVTPTIASLDGVQCLLDLTSLDIGTQPPSQVVDLSPLRGLTKLVELDLDRIPLASLEPVGALPNLERLFMIRMPVTLDLDPLAAAPKLASLFMQGDTIASLAPLGAVSTLKSLVIDGAVVQQPETIAAVTSLEILTATGVFTDAAPLARLTKLQQLRIAQKPLSHFEALSALVDLRLLDIANTGVTDISPVARMLELVHFFAGSNAISDLEPLAGLQHLSLVALNVNQIGDLKPLRDNLGIGEADFVYLGSNPISCAAQAENLAAMRQRGAQIDSECQ